uniref:Putative proteasome activator subunit n=1 Tax=Rhipicephalus microplus TaxID=6941 RepID=A0A6M2CMW6_RHIMP|nr:proteasome activator complex subunit 3-like [Rhipicephalus microplus]
MESLFATAERLSASTPGRIKVEEYKERLKKEAEELVLHKFPEKILELETLLKTDKFSKTDLAAVHVDINIPVPEPPFINHEADLPAAKKRRLETLENEITGTKVLVLPTGSVGTNNHIVSIVDIVKPKIWQLVDDTNILKMWIQFLIPRIEDGNNFGVSIQEDALTEIRAVEGEAAAFFDQISRYFLTRGKIIAKVAKYPHVEDFRRTVQELDEKQYVSLRLVLCELKNHYATLHDLITKNLEKIKRPRSSNAENMY